MESKNEKRGLEETSVEIPAPPPESIYHDFSFPPLKNDLLLRAIRREKTMRTPVWIMRQAGRYLPEFRALREASGKDFFEVCRTPELACELTLQPIRRFDLDAAIIFRSTSCMGLEVVMKPTKGPVLPSPLLTPQDVDTRLIEPDVKSSLSYVFRAITLTRHRLEGKVPLIGFSGAPWTLMAYMIEGEGSKTWSKAKTWLYRYPEQSHKLLSKLTTVIGEYLCEQVSAGAQVLQLFDSWAGELSPDMYARFGTPYLAQIADKVKHKHPHIPLILFSKGANSSLCDLSSLKYDMLSLDWTVSPSVARKETGEYSRVALQGNLDPAILYADKDTIESEVKRLLAEFGTVGHVANLGHGLSPDHSPESVAVYVDAVHRISEEIIARKS